MGCWNGTDMVTHLPIMYREKVRCVVLKHQGDQPDCGGYCYADDAWELVGPAIQAEYNDYGCVQNVVPGVAANWLEHILPLSDEAKEELKGYGEKDIMHEKLSAVERGLSFIGEKQLCLWMVHEETWQLLQKVKGECWGEFLESRVEKLLEAVLVEKDDGGISRLKRQTAIQNVFGHDHYAHDVLRWVKEEDYPEAVAELVEMRKAKNVMYLTRRYFSPMACAGGQHTVWEAHKMIAELTLKRAKAGIKAEAQDDE